jgi:hypothetical protein
MDRWSGNMTLEERRADLLTQEDTDVSQEQKRVNYHHHLQNDYT